MKYTGWLLLLILSLSSCVEKTPPLTRAQIMKKADSIFAVNAAAITAQYQEDLEKRMAVEVKPKTDSIITAIEKGIAPAADNTKPVVNAEP